jgi:hypothetical protein
MYLLSTAQVRNILGCPVSMPRLQEFMKLTGLHDVGISAGRSLYFADQDFRCWRETFFGSSATTAEVRATIDSALSHGPRGWDNSLDYVCHSERGNVWAVAQLNKPLQRH